MNKTKLLHLLFVFVFFLPAFSFAQSPTVDPNWVKDTAASDEFKKTSGTHSQNGLFTTKWILMYYGEYLSCGIGATNLGGATAFNSNYAYDSTNSGNGFLKLAADSSLDSINIPGGWTCSAACMDTSKKGKCDFNTGGVASVNSFSYGYFEISAKLPGYVSGGTGYGSKFWPTFWMANCCTRHEEIDVMDEGCSYSDCKTTGSGWSNFNTCGGSGTNKGFQYFTAPVFLCDTFHKYAVEWNTNRLVFYHDDTPYYWTLNHDSLNMSNMQVFIDLQLSCGCLFDTGTFTSLHHIRHDQSELVDYFHYYQLKHDGTNCSTVVYFADNSDINSFSSSGFGVASSFTFTNTVGPINLGSCTLPTSPSCNLGTCEFIFRAVNYFKITTSGTGNTFTIPAGTPVMFVPTACN